jgi:hypothetical protein
MDSFEMLDAAVMRRRNDLVLKLSGTCIIASLNPAELVGIAGLPVITNCRCMGTQWLGLPHVIRGLARPSQIGRSSGGSPGPTAQVASATRPCGLGWVRLKHQKGAFVAPRLCRYGRPLSRRCC